jgi:hypothetical protein
VSYVRFLYQRWDLRNTSLTNASKGYTFLEQVDYFVLWNITRPISYPSLSFIDVTPLAELNYPWNIQTEARLLLFLLYILECNRFTAFFLFKVWGNCKEYHFRTSWLIKCVHTTLCCIADVFAYLIMYTSKLNWLLGSHSTRLFSSEIYTFETKNGSLSRFDDSFKWMRYVEYLLLRSSWSLHTFQNCYIRSWYAVVLLAVVILLIITGVAITDR